jgi:hypothetical protein
MDYVYICRKGENEELKYSIRSVVKNTNYSNIWVVGHKPSWYVGNFVEVLDVKTKFSNIINCTKAITDVGAISDDFVLMNDDFFFLKYRNSMPVFHGGLLKDKIDKYSVLGARKYAELLRKTYKDLIRQGIKDPLDYDLHLPMPMNKQLLAKSIDKAYFPRSGYGNLNNIGGQLITDVKAYKPKSILSSRSFDFTKEDAEFISTEDGSFNLVYESILKEMFTERSRFEKIVLV